MTTDATHTLSLTDVDTVLPAEFQLLQPSDPHNDAPHALRVVRHETTDQPYAFDTPRHYLQFVLSVSPRRLLADVSHTRYSAEEVTTFLECLGMHLDFQMEAFLPPAYSELAQLPAQFHFEHASGMSIIYLAGEDRAPEDGERLPPHKSRFWAYPGADTHVFGRTTQSVALRWSFTWLCLSQAQQDVA